MSRTLGKTLRTALASPSTSVIGGIKRYGFDHSAAGPSRWDEARNPVVRDSLVPIVVEQTVCPVAFALSMFAI
jgi:hypothetical protein